MDAPLLQGRLLAALRQAEGRGFDLLGELWRSSQAGATIGPPVLTVSDVLCTVMPVSTSSERLQAQLPAVALAGLRADYLGFTAYNTDVRVADELHVGEDRYIVAGIGIYPTAIALALSKKKPGS